MSSTRPRKTWLPGARYYGFEPAANAPLEESINSTFPTRHIATTKGWKSGASKSRTLEGSSQSHIATPPEALIDEASTATPESRRPQDVSATYKRRSLPMSPLMDPTFLAARQEHKGRKLPPTKEPTGFQQQLAKNPYALALGTPVRRCAITNVRLPAYFLQDFMVMKEPETGSPWYIPVSLANEHLPATKLAAENPEVGSGAATEREKTQPFKVGYKIYTLNTKTVLQAIQDPTSGYSHSQKKKKGKTEFVPSNFIPVKMRGIKAAMDAYGKARWRPDMEDFIPELMSRRVISSLVHLKELKRGYLVGCRDWDDAFKKPQAAAYLWMGKKGDNELEGPHEFATLDVGTQGYNEVGSQLGRMKHKVPVYNMRTILGENKLSQLRKHFPDSKVVVLKHKNATVRPQSMLWKMQGYIAKHQWADEDEAPQRTSNSTE